MADAMIKADPDAPGASPSTFTDEDIYEDAGDLEFNTDPKFQAMYLARVPKYVWEEWNRMDDDAEINIGRIRQTSERRADGTDGIKLEMLLDSRLAQHQRVPKEYELQLISESVQNTYVFTEQNVAGFKPRAKYDPSLSQLNARFKNPRVEKPGDKQPYDKNKKFKPYFRPAIPKKTVLVGKVAHEVNCVAVINAESDRILAERTLEAMKPKKGTIRLLGDTVERQFVQAGTVRDQGAFGGFIKNIGNTRGKPAQEVKTARMPENELLDLIFACFRRYSYWSMKALRAELHQPEAYLRETLEKIADMPRSGSFAMHWTLKQEFKDAASSRADEGAAPTGLGGMDGVNDSDMGDVDADDDDDENVKMEDVLP